MIKKLYLITVMDKQFFTVVVCVLLGLITARCLTVHTATQTWSLTEPLHGMCSAGSTSVTMLLLLSEHTDICLY